ncbi:hypothetical protein [Bacillus kexueae]|uniref:hypothetical protein n=1 Tax=Aeribacillus kexueae TaxID=2078952 RepID=UPI001FAFF9F4|nr:hypothetical protein [Bacillus kexueae]
MAEKVKRRVELILLVALILSLISSFVLFFLQFYKVALALGAFFMLLANFIGFWAYSKTTDYVHRTSYHTNKDRYK